MKSIITTFKNDVVLSVSACLAFISCFINKPSLDYLGYIDFHTLVILFCLMIVIEGIKQQNLFQWIADTILVRVHSNKAIVTTLVLLCFFSSMLITNDVALITFVPFGLLLMKACHMETSICLTITLMTIAANLGSMFTPIGNPQNLYLFSLSKMSLGSFLTLMLKPTVISGILLILAIVLGYQNTRVEIKVAERPSLNTANLLFFGILFVLSLGCVAHLINTWLLLAIVLICILIKDRTLLKQADYALLMTFVFFFIFIGNMKHLESLNTLLLDLVSGNECLISIALSQIISNVPAAMLLSNFTTNIDQLILGTNIGGLGTLIASMASLISYKQINNHYPQFKSKYIKIFTIFNVCFLIILVLFTYI